MPLDLVTIKALAYELDNKLRNTRIEKISEPHSDEIIFTIRADKTSYMLVLSSNPNNPRIHLTTTKKFNPYAAPSFCMLLRKHLGGAVINGVSLINNDRVIRIALSARDELYDLKNLSIIVELMGRYSNILLVSEENKIIDAIRHIAPDESEKRFILPNVEYIGARPTRIDPDHDKSVKECLSKYVNGDLAKYLADNVGGLSYLTANEIINRANVISEFKLTEIMIDFIINQLKIFNNIVNYDIYSPSVLINDTTPKDFLIMPYRTVIGDYKRFNTINEAADYYYSIKDSKERLKAASKSLLNIVNNHIKRTEKALFYAEEKLLECEKMDSYREYGDMILANLYKINKGMSEIIVDNFFNGEKSTISLDVTLNPSQNANKFYKKYSKLARSKKIVKEQKEEHIISLNYLKSIIIELSLIKTPEEVDEIKEELIEMKIMQAQSSGKKIRKPVKTAPRSYIIDNFKVYSGKNNIDNEMITFKLAGSTDLFLHAKQLHGSHVIIMAEGRVIPENVVVKAAEIAAFYSEGRNSDKVAVDYTFKRYVRKHPSGMKGMVIYTDYSSVMVKPKDNTSI